MKKMVMLLTAISIALSSNYVVSAAEIKEDLFVDEISAESEEISLIDEIDYTEEVSYTEDEVFCEDIISADCLVEEEVVPVEAAAEVISNDTATEEEFEVFIPKRTEVFCKCDGPAMGHLEYTNEYNGSFCTINETIVVDDEEYYYIGGSYITNRWVKASDCITIIPVTYEVGTLSYDCYESPKEDAKIIDHRNGNLDFTIRRAYYVTSDKKFYNIGGYEWIKSDECFEVKYCKPAEDAVEFKYCIINDSVTIVGYKKLYERIDSKECYSRIIIPEELDGYPVTKIAPSSFIECGYSIYENPISDIVLPNSLREIGLCAFSHASLSLDNDLVIPEGVTSIGDRAFCISWHDSRKSSKGIVFPSTLTTIGDYAFSGWIFNKDIIIPGNVKTIGDYAFYGEYTNSNVNVILSEGIESIGTDAFKPFTYNMDHINVVIPSTIKKIKTGGLYAFFDEEYIEWYEWYKSILKDPSRHTYYGYYSEEQILEKVNEELKQKKSEYYKSITRYFSKDFTVLSITNNSSTPMGLPGNAFGENLLNWKDLDGNPITTSYLTNGTAIRDGKGVCAEISGDNFVLAGQKINLEEIFEYYGSESGVKRYKVDNSKIASIDKTYLAGKSAGDVRVTLQEMEDGVYEDIAACTVTVLNKPKFSFPTLTYISQSIDVYNMDYCLTEDTQYAMNTMTVSWSSGTPGTVVYDADTGSIVAKKEGTATIITYFGEKGQPGTLKILTKVTVKCPKFQKNSYKLKTGEKYVLSMKNVTKDMEVELASEDPSIAKVYPQLDKKGNKTGKIVVEALSCGDTMITATIDDQEYTCDINISAPKINKTKLNMKKGKYATLSLSNTKIKKADVVWQSENDSIAVIENGKIKAISEGTVTIFTTTGGLRNECTVTVK